MSKILFALFSIFNYHYYYSLIDGKLHYESLLFDVYSFHLSHSRVSENTRPSGSDHHISASTYYIGVPQTRREINVQRTNRQHNI